MYNRLCVKQLKLVESYVWLLFLLIYGAICLIHFEIILRIKVILFLLYCLYLGYLSYLHQLFGRCQDYIIQAQLLENKTWLLTNYSGIKQEYQLLGDSFVSRHWVIMRFCNDRVIARKKKTIILVKHRQPKDTWRTLQVYLRYLNKKI